MGAADLDQHRPGRSHRERILTTAISLFSGARLRRHLGLDVCERAGVVKTPLLHFDRQGGPARSPSSAWPRPGSRRSRPASAGRRLDARLDRFVSGLRWLVLERSETRLILARFLERALVDDARRREPAAGSWCRRARRSRRASADTLGRDLPDLDLIADVALALVKRDRALAPARARPGAPRPDSSERSAETFRARYCRRSQRRSVMVSKRSSPPLPCPTKNDWRAG